MVVVALREFLTDLAVCLCEGKGGGGHDVLMAALWNKMIGTVTART